VTERNEMGIFKKLCIYSFFLSEKKIRHFLSHQKN
jgi:hypothetical protein